jgi:hypothetical protein
MPRNLVPANAKTIAAWLIDNADDKVFLLGPVVRNPAYGPKRYFMILSGDEAGACQIDQINVENEDGRTAILAELALHRGVVLIDTDDELELAKWGEARWPGERISRIRADLERERKH